MLFNTLIPFQTSAANNDTVVYPLKQISKLECRFEDFDTLSSGCKMTLPVLKTKDYNKYATQNGWYNDFTRIYTVLWGASYKYGWDVWNGGHQGTDIATAKWTPVYSIADWKVIATGNDVGWGRYVSIEHIIRGKKVISNYAHLSKVNVNKWSRVDASDKIGEVGSTWNSTWNHLHFQIDLPSSFHPYYYDWNACPYSYYEITEKGVCFDELQKHTFDPLAFLETSWAVLDSVSSVVPTNTQSKTTLPITASSLNDVLTTTVYYGYGTSYDVKNVQELYTLLGYYKGEISGDFSDVEKSIIAYQIATGVIENKNSDGAGWFGPKTRAQTKKDYASYLANGWKVEVKQVINEEVTQKTVSNQKVNTVSRVKLKTREEIEAQELEEFMRSHDINFINAISQIEQGATKTTTLKVSNQRGRWYRWNTPGNVTFAYDESIVSVFPKSFYNFSDGMRDIKITGLKKGHTKVQVKIWSVVVKTLSVSVWNAWESSKVSDADLYVGRNSIIGEENTWVIVLKDQYGAKIVRSEFRQTLKIDANAKVQYCIKRGRIQDIKKLYNRKCFDQEFKDELTYTYSDTIDGVLLFDYRVLDAGNAKLSLTTGGKNLAEKNITASLPHGLDNYEYSNEVLTVLENWIGSEIINGHFKQDTKITKRDAVNWITNAIELEWWNTSEIDKETKNSQELTRWDFLALLDSYLWGNRVSVNPAQFRDTDEDIEDAVAKVLWNTYQWRDNFWENYFQPDKEINRWEAAYMLVQALEAQSGWALARR